MLFCQIFNALVMGNKKQGSKSNITCSSVDVNCTRAHQDLQVKLGGGGYEEKKRKMVSR